MSVLTLRPPRPAATMEYRLLLALTFPFFLAGALLRRGAVGPMRSPAPSLWRDARGRAAAVLPFVFHG